MVFSYEVKHHDRMIICGSPYYMPSRQVMALALR